MDMTEVDSGHVGTWGNKGYLRSPSFISFISFNNSNSQTGSELRDVWMQ